MEEETEGRGREEGGGGLGPGARRGGQRGLDTGTQGQAQGRSHEPDEPREDRVSWLSRLSARGCTEVGKRGPPGLRTWGPADIGREEPVGSLPRVQAHQVELPEVGHVKHSSGPSAGQTLLLDLKSSRGGVLCGLWDLPLPQDPGALGLWLPSCSESPSCLLPLQLGTHGDHPFQAQGTLSRVDQKP